MKKEVIGEAATIEEAKEKAAMLLAAPAEADVSFEIVAMPQKKVLGIFGGSPAKVKASYDDGKPEPKQPKPEIKPAPAAEKKAEPKAQKPKAEKPVKTEKKKKAEKKAEAPKKAKEAVQPEPAEEKAAAPKKKSESAYPSDEVTANCVAYLKEILGGLDVKDAEIQPKQSDEGLYLNIDCDHYGIIIGRRGETLDSIQYLVSLVANKDAGNYIRVTINVGSYREKREETLRRLAQKTAARVLRSGRRVVLEPMNPYERRIIHTAVQEIEGVSSRSVGSNNDRKVIIEAEDGYRTGIDHKDREEHSERRGRGDYNRGRGGARNSAPAAPSRKLTKEELPKFGKIQ